MFRRRSSHPQSDQDSLRCVIDDTGALVFVSPQLGWALGQASSSLAGKDFSSFIRIVSSHDSKYAKLDYPSLASGFYEAAILRETRDPWLVDARIDRVEAPGNKVFTVIWLDPENKMKRQKAGDFKDAARALATFVTENRKNVDVPETDKAEESAIAKTDGELRHFLNLTSDLLGVYNRDLAFVRVNPAWNRMLGFSDAELRGFPFIDLVHPEDREQVQAAVQKVVQAPLDEETRIGFECGTRCKDGAFRSIEWTQKSSGPHIYIVGKDVTDMKRHEAELLRREQQLSEAQKIGRMGHWLWEIDRVEMEWSDQIYDIFGVEKGKFLPSIDNVNTLLLKRDLGRIFKSFQRALLRKKDYELEFRLRRPGGGIRFIRCEGRCRIDPKTGHVTALFGIMQDITERTLHERALREAKESAESAYASKTRFLANMSHELRTPLNAVIGFSEMIQRQLLGPVGNPRYLEYVAGIRQSGEHLLDLINDILDMSKIEIGKYELYAEDINVGKVVRLAIHMVEGRAHESQVRLISDDIPDDVHIEADRRALMQILLNLLSNAVKFTKPGGAVEIKCQRELGGIAIIVMDTGIGIPKDKLNLVTLPFEQVSSEFTRNHEGSGLGLAITKDLIEMHGGRMEIDSEVGVGTTVAVLLPEKMQARAKEAG